mmetsp:Transcript_7666/g.11001  ORF Transcript_7666/g.11001 Transcript_7666/m.11001 type:complete len:162 (+) Transcript_7666:81-566(+)
MTVSTSRPLVAMLLTLFASQCVAFGIVGRTGSKSRSAATMSPLFVRQSDEQRNNRLLLSTERTTTTAMFMAENGAKDDEIENNKNPAEEREKAEGFGPLTAALLAVPLVCKFVIVLLIKFMTDLVVYPLLLLYRLARMTKNKFLRLIGKDDKDSNKSALES